MHQGGHTHKKNGGFGKIASRYFHRLLDHAAFETLRNLEKNGFEIRPRGCASVFTRVIRYRPSTGSGAVGCVASLVENGKTFYQRGLTIVLSDIGRVHA